MNNKTLSYFFIITVILISVVLFSYSFAHLQFNLDAIYKINEQRGEHVNFFFKESYVFHNKFSYFINIITTIYLEYLSPSTIFLIYHFPVSIIISITFYYGVFAILKSRNAYRIILLYWMIITPLFLALLLQKPYLLSMIIFQLPIFIFFIAYLLNKKANH